MRPTLRSTGRDRPDGGCELRAVQTSATRPKRTAAKARDFRSVPGLESGKDKRERQGEMLRNPRQACSELNRSNHGEHCAAGLPSADSQPRDAAPCRPLHLPTGKPPVQNRQCKTGFADRFSHSRTPPASAASGPQSDALNASHSQAGHGSPACAPASRVQPTAGSRCRERNAVGNAHAIPAWRPTLRFGQ